MQTLKKRRVLNLPHESVTNRFETLAFTHDDMYIMAITGEPDWNMVCYNWTKGKVSSVTKAIHPGTSVTQVDVTEIWSFGKLHLSKCCIIFLGLLFSCQQWRNIFNWPQSVPVNESE